MSSNAKFKHSMIDCKSLKQNIFAFFKEKEIMNFLHKLLTSDFPDDISTIGGVVMGNYFIFYRHLHCPILY